MHLFFVRHILRIQYYFYYDNQSIMRTQVDILEWTHFVNLIIN